LFSLVTNNRSKATVKLSHKFCIYSYNFYLRFTKRPELKLRFGKLTTLYKHFSLITEGVAGEFTSCCLAFVLYALAGVPSRAVVWSCDQQLKPGHIQSLHFKFFLTGILYFSSMPLNFEHHTQFFTSTIFRPCWCSPEPSRC